ncbi:MAG TPA: hypothetical protein VFR23_09140 [Jiangellaceae bacterium]|nr:hypothetical protein [Jiangellaceae bacterium]
MTVEPLAEVHGNSGSAPVAEPIPVLPALHGLLPGGLPRGQVITVDAVGALPLALVAGAIPMGVPTVDLWCGVVGLPQSGMLAAAGMGANLDRLVLVDKPGERWADVVATLLPATRVVLVQPPVPPPIGVIRRLTALARQHGAALVVIGPWEGARLRLQVTSSLWTGLEHGHGHLQGRRVKVVADGRGAGGRPRSAWLWLPSPDGSVASADLEVVGSLEAAG